MTNLAIETSEIAEEIGTVKTDARLARRAMKIMERWRENPGVGFPQVFEDSAELEALYRFFNNSALDFDVLLDAHVEKTIERCELEKTVLILEDTTTFCFGGASRRDGLGRINKNNKGFLGHFALAVSGNSPRFPLGVLGVDTLTRAEDIKKGAVPQKQRRDLSDCESHRWLRTVQHTEKLIAGRAATVHIMDREGDIYDSVATMVEQNIRFVVRAASNRSIRSDDKEFSLLFDALDGLPARYREKVNVSARTAANMPDQKKLYPSRKGRTADVVVTATTACIKRTKHSAKDLPPNTTINMVHVFEPAPPKKQSPVEWILLTNEPINDDDQVRRVVESYRARWLIEEYFKAIKTGCAYEKRQLGSYHALKNALAMAIPIAWEMLLLRHQVHQDNLMPASDIIDEFRLLVLGAMAKRYRLPENPTVKDVAYAIAGMGGHLLGNGPPGWLTLRRGYEKLLVCEDAWREAMKKNDQS